VVTSPEKRLCLYCEKPLNLNVGRKDRRFCDEQCKNKYHNTKTWEEEKEIKRIQLVLKKNRRILKKMFARKDHDEIAKDRLLKEGFEFDFHTHFVETYHYKRQYTCCFDYGYRLTKDKYKIIEVFKNKEE
jgi:hypothetical protein